MIAVTTFSKTGYDEYAYRLLESAVKYWPSKLIVYHEGHEPPIKDEKIEYRHLLEIPALVAFLQHLRNFPIAHGKMPDGSYNYNYDCWKFCRKVFAQLDVLKDDPGLVFWLDADIVLNQPVPEEFLRGLLDHYALAYLGREGFYTETGFIGFNTGHESFPAFRQKYEDCYRRGIILTLQRWHDCEAFDWARAQIAYVGNNLSEFYRHKQTPLNVLPKTVLAPFMVHDKGGRKFGTKKEPLRATV